MKRLLRGVVLIGALSGTAFAQAPAGGQARGGRPNIFAPPATASGTLVDVVNAIVAAFNKQDKAYFQKIIAPDTVWFDEDGHHFNAMVWMDRMLSATPPRQLTVTNLRTGNWDTGGWAGFNYVIQSTAMPQLFWRSRIRVRISAVRSQ